MPNQLKPNHEPIGLALAGLRTWGRNHLRVFSHLEQARIRYIFDEDPRQTAQQVKANPRLTVAADFRQILQDDQVRAVVLCTPAQQHFEMGRAALEAGKDLLIEKPLTTNAEQAEALCRLAEQNQRILQVSHLMLFHPAVDHLKKLIDSGELGELYYLYSQRLNLGLLRSEEDSLWSLAPHDLALVNDLLGAQPRHVQASGGCSLKKGIKDVIFIHLSYSDGQIVNIHVSWLDPRKTRRLTVVGSKKMAVFDDMAATEKIRLYDKGVSRVERGDFGEVLSVRTGDIVIPNIPNQEPLRRQAIHFLDCLARRKQPKVTGRHGLAVVRTLEAAQRQLARTS